MTRPVSVIIPYFEDQAGLDLVLAALEAQTMSPSMFEVIVADDGSATAPATGDRPFPIQVVRQPDRGFRAGAARNLGAGVAQGSTLVLLDGDTIPSPDYLDRLVACCSDGNTLAVGARRHVDLTGWDPHRLRQWLIGVGEPPPDLPNPQWLEDGYRATDNLRASDDTSFRFVISAVMALPATLFARMGGFDESFTAYGGEDWDLAQRCWLAGADLVHEPDAVAFHDGGDAAARGNLTGAKNRETLHLARTLTHPMIRGTGLIHEIPDIVVTADTTGWTDGQVVVTVQSLLTGSDAGVWLTGPHACHHRALLAQDPRVHVGRVPDRTLSRCRFQVEMRRPVAFSSPPSGYDSPLRYAITRATADVADGAVTVGHTRALNRAGPQSCRAVPDSLVTDLPGDLIIERWRGQQAT